MLFLEAKAVKPKSASCCRPECRQETLAHGLAKKAAVPEVSPAWSLRALFLPFSVPPRRKRSPWNRTKDPWPTRQQSFSHGPRATPRILSRVLPWSLYESYSAGGAPD